MLLGVNQIEDYLLAILAAHATWRQYSVGRFAEINNARLKMRRCWKWLPVCMEIGETRLTTNKAILTTIRNIKLIAAIGTQHDNLWCRLENALLFGSKSGKNLCAVGRPFWRIIATANFLIVRQQSAVATINIDEVDAGRRRFSADSLTNKTGS